MTGTNQGFTFVELLVVMVTMALLFSLGYANYRDFSRRQEIESWARRIEGDLRLAQQYASSGKKTAGCSVLDGYQFSSLQHPFNRYAINPVCTGVIGSSIKIVNLPSHIQISTLPPVLFKVLEQGNSLTTPSTTVTLTAYGLTETVTITSGGEIY